ncbi:MAG: ATP-binding cassette domain-containing protein, partial [Rhodocyclales bacterium]|nr:ATP-binding cassette domain-containing protein [Rhodocyclales bacterium]
CRFAERCPSAWGRCHAEIPAWHGVGEGHRVRCHLYDQGSGSREQGSEGRSRLAGDPTTEPPASRLLQVGSPLLEVADLKVHFPVRKGVLKRTVGHVKAVDGVSLSIGAGRTLALVGESGCGKTTAGKAILQLLRPTAGSVRLDGEELTALSPQRLRPLRSAMQIVFQDPYASLDPRMRVGDIIEEGLAALGLEGGRTVGLMEKVGLSADMRGRYPHEFSGGQRQRIAIARALAVNPRLLVCDEPTSALDVSVQAQILNLLKALQASLGLSYLFITHNIAVVDYLAHEVAVMYLGRIVEHGTAEEILGTPKHPYTEALLSAVPRVDGEGGRPFGAAQDRPVIVLKGDMPSPVNPPTGCHFHPRCPRAMDLCRKDYPGETRLGGTRSVRCHLYD